MSAQKESINKSIDEPILCRAAISAPLTATGEMMYMPAGIHEITPSQNGRAVKVKVLIDPASAAAVEAQRKAIQARGKRPYFDFNHEDRAASFWPESFFWKDGADAGIYAKGEWTKSGKEGVEGKDWRQFSPTFYVDNVRANPARIQCKETAAPCMGGLVNDPAFHEILPFWAKAAGAHSSDNQTKTPTMTPEEKTAALQAKNQELEQELSALKAREEKDKTDASVAALIKAKEAEIKAVQTEEKLTALTAKNDALEAAEKARREKDADDAVKAAVARGAIAVKDEATQKQWRGLVESDPANAALLAKLAGSSALTSGRVTATPGVQVTEESALSALNAFDAERDPKKRAALYAKDISPRIRDFMDMPLNAANSPGTLAGTLVTQRTLELLKFTFPILRAISTDFSAENAAYGQTIMSRIVTVPGVSTYSPTAGWTTQNAATPDVSVTINNHIGVPISFDANTLAGTMRNLFEEQAPAQAYALALKMVNDLYALITPANFTAAGIAVALANFGRSNVIDIGTALQLAGVPQGPANRSLLLYSSYFGALAKDSSLVTLSAFKDPAIIEDGTLPNVHGFKVIDAPNLPGNAAYVTGFGFSKSALVLATRVPNDYTKALPGASFGNVQVVTDPDLGISVQQVQYVNHDMGSATQRMALMYGVAKGQAAAGQLLTSQ